MRLLSRLAFAGLISLASATTKATALPADVYILSNTQLASSEPIPHTHREIARHVLLQRLGRESQLDDIPDGLTAEDALDHIARYGKAPKPLFSDNAAASATPEANTPSQLLMVLEGVLDDRMAAISKSLSGDGLELAFHVDHAPSSEANQHLVDVELSSIAGSCDVAAAINPYDKCWKGMSLAVKYDVAKVRFSLTSFSQQCTGSSFHDHGTNPLHQHPEIVQSLVDNLPALREAISSSTLEATILVLPESTRHSAHKHWAAPSPVSELRRRAEAPLSGVPKNKVVVAPGSGGVVAPPSLSAAADDDTTTPAKMNLGCFTSYNSCVSATGNCTGHGECVDRYATGAQGQADDRVCFVCACKSTKTHPEIEDQDLHTHWGGAYCQKIDVSSPFWLLFGTSLLLVGVVTGSIALLFNVGEEKLPGVIGAGVSRSK